MINPFAIWGVVDPTLIYSNMVFDDLKKKKKIKVEYIDQFLYTKKLKSSEWLFKSLLYHSMNKVVF